MPTSNADAFTLTNTTPPPPTTEMEQWVCLIHIELQIIPSISIIHFVRIVDRLFHGFYRLQQLSRIANRSLALQIYWDRVREVQSERTSCLMLGRELFILWKRISNPIDRIARFDIITEHYLCRNPIIKYFILLYWNNNNIWIS